jgi:hypothetical protein
VVRLVESIHPACGKRMVELNVSAVRRYKSYAKEVPGGQLDKEAFKKLYAGFFPDGNSEELYVTLSMHAHMYVG